MESISSQQQTLLDKIKLVEYWDFEEILQWYYDRNIHQPEKWNFSDTGFIVPKVCAGFLYTTNSGVAFLDGFISNPKAESKDRIAALQLVSESLIHKAKANNSIHKLCCTTKNETIMGLAEVYGFGFVDNFGFFVKSFNR